MSTAAAREHEKLILRERLAALQAEIDSRKGNVPNAPQPPAKRAPPCSFFLAGHCSRGASCSFSHAAAPPPRPPPAAASSSAAAAAPPRPPPPPPPPRPPPPPPPPPLHAADPSLVFEVGEEEGDGEEEADDDGADEEEASWWRQQQALPSQSQRFAPPEPCRFGAACRFRATCSFTHPEPLCQLAADDLDLVLASALGVVPNAKAEDEGYGTAQYLDSEGSEGEGEYSDSEGGEEDWDDIDAVDRASSEALDALAASLASVPCRKGGAAVADVRVQEKRMPKKGGGFYWRIRVLCDTRYKPKSKEKAGHRLCIARSEHSDRREARGAAEADAVAGLRAVSAGTTTLRELSAERRKHGEPQIDTRADKSGQPGFVVLDLEPGKKGKKRQKGQPRKPQLWVRGPNGKEGHYATRTLRGLRVGPGDQLRWHGLPNPRHCYFTLDSRHPKNAHLGSWRGRGAIS